MHVHTTYVSAYSLAHSSSVVHAAAAPEPSYEWPTSVDVNLPLHLSHPASARALCTAPISLHRSPLHPRFSSSATLTRARLEHPVSAPLPPAPSNQLFRRGERKKKERTRSEREGGRGRNKKIKERGKLGLDEKMLRPVRRAMHTRVATKLNRSLFRSHIHPRARRKKKERAGEKEGMAFTWCILESGPFHRKRHRFFAIYIVNKFRGHRWPAFRSFSAFSLYLFIFIK